MDSNQIPLQKTPAVNEPSTGGLRSKVGLQSVLAESQAVFLRHPLLTLCLFGFFAYGLTLSFASLTYFDDYFFLLDWAEFNNDLANVIHAFREDAFHKQQGGSYYRPLLTISWIFDAQISGTDLWMYRVTNLALHLAAISLLFRLLVVSGHTAPRSLVLAALFAVHPALTQAVAWIPGRNDSLLALFLLGSFLMLVRYVRSTRPLDLAAHLLLLLAAFLAKESAVLFPPIALMYILLNGKQRPWLRTVVIIAGWLLAFSVWWSLRMSAAIAAPPIESFPSIGQIVNILVAYFGKVVWPFSLSVKPVAADLSLMPGVVGIVAFFFLARMSSSVHWKGILLGWVWFIVLLVPTFSWHPANPYPMKFYEHRLYVPLVGLLLAVASLEPPRWLLREGMKPLLVTVVLFVFLVGTISHSLTFRNGLSFWENAARTSPNDETNRNRISMMQFPATLAAKLPPDPQRWSDRSALTNLERDLSNQLKETRSADLLQSLAVISFGLGYLQTSEERFLEAKELDPSSPEISYNLGVLYYRAGLLQKAEEEWNATLAKNNRHAEAMSNLCYLFYKQKRYLEAIERCEQAQRLGGQVSRELISELRSLVGRDL